MFGHACDAVDLLLAVKWRRITMAEGATRLQAILRTYMGAHAALFATDHVKPKHHWAFDVCEQMLMDSTLFDSFIVERLHLRVRDIAEHCKGGHYEKSVLSGVTNQHAHLLHEARNFDCLLGERQAVCQELGGAIVADRLEYGGRTIGIGDFVYKHNRVACVAACADEGELFLIVDDHQKVADVTPTSSTWAPMPSRSIWRCEGSELCAVWRKLSDGQFIVLTA